MGDALPQLRERLAALSAPKPEPMIRTMMRDAGFPDVASFVASLKPVERVAIYEAWDLWALPHQRMPAGKWRRWKLRGGRGMGKTTAANNTLHQVARNKKALGTGIIGIIGRTHDDVRIVNVCDPGTGILATAPSDFRPKWQPGPGILTWPNGVIGRVFSADAPDSIRGNNFAWLLADELQSWPNGEKTWWEIVEPAVRVGRAQIMITCTPKPMKWLRDLESMTDPDNRTIRTGGSTYSNPFLTREALSSYEHAYAGREIGKQELGGEYIEQVRGALLTYAAINGGRVPVAPRDFKQIIIAVDPAVTNTEESDETGIIVYGHTADDQGYVLADESGKFDIESGEWAERVVQLYREWGATLIIVEANNGGDHIGGSLMAIDRSIPYEKKTATKSKEARALPVSMLYKRGRIHHIGNPNRFTKLEHEWTNWVPGEGKSPNRLDALVWAATHCHIQEDAKPQGASCIGLLGPQRK
jgi:phage terminase large subunit-like protein